MDGNDSPSEGWTFPFCPRPPSWSLDWDGIVAALSCVREMAGCPQEPEWHEEGDVLTHTQMACQALIESDAWRNLSCEERSVVFAATLLHDVGKPSVTREERGRIQSPHHAATGARMVRRLLMTGLLPTVSLEALQRREQIVALVRHHGLPLHFLDKPDTQRRVFAASQTVRCDWLALLAQTDVLGRQCRDQNELLERVELFRTFCREEQCFAHPRLFASNHTRFVYFQGRHVAPDVELFDDTRLAVVLMCGLPAAGKDHWIATGGPHWPVVALDAIRTELKTAPDANQGPVIAEARERARTFLRCGTSFIWNATNTSKSMRSQLVQFFRQYDAAIRIVYVEAQWHTMLQRNRSRSNSVPQAVLERLAEKLDVPDISEAHCVDLIVGLQSVR